MGRDTSVRDERRRAIRRQESFAKTIFEANQRSQQLAEKRADRQEELTNLSLGFVKDSETGEFVRAPLTETQQRSQGIRSRLQERQLDALEGNLPVSQATENEIAEEEALLKSRLREEFGPNFERTTGGIQTLRRFLTAASERRDRERRGDITGLESSLTTRASLDLQRTGQELTGIRGISNPPPPSAPNVLRPINEGPAPRSFISGAAPEIGGGLGEIFGRFITGGPTGGRIGRQLGRGVGEGLGNIF